MVDWVRDGSRHPIPFTFLKDGEGVDLQIDGTTPASALVDGDVLVYSWFDDGTTYGTSNKRVVDVSVEIQKVDAIDAPGDVRWFPQAVDTRCNHVVLVIRDADGGGAFNENRVVAYTHGRFDAAVLANNSRFNGT